MSTETKFKVNLLYFSCCLQLEITTCIAELNVSGLAFYCNLILRRFIYFLLRQIDI